MTEGGRWVGAPVPRKEDEALLTGHARFIDDMEPVPGIRHAALLRSPHAHADIVSIDISNAASHPGVHGVVTGVDISAAINPIPSAVRVPIDYYPMAVDKVRYAGEPVALVAAEDRYAAEDALELIEVEYRPLPPVIDLKAAMDDGSPLLHEAVGSNVAHHRTFRYGDPDNRVRGSRPRRSAGLDLPALFLDPGGDLRRGRAIRAGARPLHDLVQFPGTVHPARADVRRAQGDGQPAPPDHGAAERRQLRDQAGPVPLPGAAGGGEPPPRHAAQVDRGPAGAPGGFFIGASNREDAVEAAFQGRRHPDRSSGSSMSVDVGAYIRAPEPASVYRMHSRVQRRLPASATYLSKTGW